MSAGASLRKGSEMSTHSQTEPAAPLAADHAVVGQIARPTTDWALTPVRNTPIACRRSFHAGRDTDGGVRVKWLHLGASPRRNLH